MSLPGESLWSRSLSASRGRDRRARDSNWQKTCVLDFLRSSFFPHANWLWGLRLAAPETFRLFFRIDLPLSFLRLVCLLGWQWESKDSECVVSNVEGRLYCSLHSGGKFVFTVPSIRFAASIIPIDSARSALEAKRNIIKTLSLNI